ncbi:carboxypeptidase-like regulatory domain-containing protein, partial [uncultured Chitinophaga sp.]|uniref:carboxypeptidase-like regulatory domain-containing protein n=1 Tax=uncultured Chitinophaga sp. TaxID=339340 RepID=UPI0025EBEBAD
MKNCLNLISCALLLLVCSTGFAQVKVSGKVTDDQGEAIPGVTVVQQNTRNGAVTTPEGTFTLTLNSTAPQALQFSFMGFLPQTVSYSGSGDLNVVLKKDEVALKDVIVVGYGTQKKSQVTGAIAS